MTLAEVLEINVRFFEFERWFLIAEGAFLPILGHLASCKVFGMEGCRFSHNIGGGFYGFKQIVRFLHYLRTGLYLMLSILMLYLLYIGS